MTIIPDMELQRIKALGYEGLMQEIAEGKHCQPTSPYRDAVDAVLSALKASADSAALARLEAHEKETIAVAQEANDIAREAKRWAMYAAIAAVIALIIAITTKP